MTKLNVFAGICGFTTQVVSTDKGGYKAELSITSECQNWTKVNKIFEGKEFNVMTELFKDRSTGSLHSEIIDISLKNTPHVSCPVISGALKALEVSVGLALPKDATITFVQDE
ncbi:MAG: hypothetical protein ACI8ZB_004928 [Desulforhopalus sp.]|jgi:hypothetical protein